MLRPWPARAAARVWRLLPGPVWLILILHLMVVLWQTAVFPNFRSPDERQHVDLIVMVEQGRAWPWPDQGTLPVSEGSSAGGFTRSNRIPGRLELAAQDLPSRGERPSYLDAGGTRPADLPANQLIQHPPLYYLAGAALLAVVPGWQDTAFDRVYLLLRWWNVLLAAVLPVLLWAIARQLRLPDPVPIAAALIPLAIPELTHTESSVNNDNLLVVLFAAITLLLARVLTGDTSRRTAVGIGVLTTLALLTKGFALLLPAWIGLAYLVAGVRLRRQGASGSTSRFGFVAPAALVGLAIAWAAALPGLGWWIRNKLVYGSLQPHGRFSENPDLTPRFGWSDGGPGWLFRLVERMNTLFFVHDQTGQRLHHGPWKMAIVAGGLVLVGVAVAVAVRALPRLTSLVLLVPVVGLFAIVAKGSWEQYAANQIYAGMQGRYLYGGLAGLGVVAIAATARLPERARGFVPLALLGFATVIQAVYLAYTLRLFWAPHGSGGIAAVSESVAAMLQWYPLPAFVPVLIVAATVVAAVATVIALVRVGLGRSEGLSRRRPEHLPSRTAERADA